GGPLRPGTDPVRAQMGESDMSGLGKWALLSLSIGTVAGLPPRRDDAQTFAGRAGVADRSSIVDMLELAGEGFASQARGPSPGFVAAPDPQWDGMRARHDPAFEPRADNSPIPSAS